MKRLRASLAISLVIWIAPFAFAHERDGPVSIEAGSIEHLAGHLRRLASNPDWEPSFTDPNALRAAMQAAAAEHDDTVITAADIGKVYVIYSLIRSGDLEPDGSNLTLDLRLKASSEITKEDVLAVAKHLESFVLFEARLTMPSAER